MYDPVSIGKEIQSKEWFGNKGAGQPGQREPAGGGSAPSSRKSV